MKKKVNLIALVVLVIAGSFLILQSFDEYWYLAGARTLDKEGAMYDYIFEFENAEMYDYEIAYSVDEHVINIYIDNDGNVGCIQTIEENEKVIVSLLVCSFDNEVYHQLRHIAKNIYISVDEELFLDDVQAPQYNEIELEYPGGKKTVYVTVYDRSL